MVAAPRSRILHLSARIATKKQMRPMQLNCRVSNCRQWENPTVTGLGAADCKHAYSRFATGVMIAAAREQGEIYAVTISSFAPVSLDPATVLFCLHEQSRALPVFLRSMRMGLSVLSATQRYLSDRFARQAERPLGAHWLDLDSEIGRAHV